MTKDEAEKIVERDFPKENLGNHLRDGTNLFRYRWYLGLVEPLDGEHRPLHFMTRHREPSSRDIAEFERYIRLAYTFWVLHQHD